MGRCTLALKHGKRISLILEESSQDLMKGLQKRWQDWQGEEMHNWTETEVLAAIHADPPRSVAGRRMSRVVFEAGTDLRGQDLRKCVITDGMLNSVGLDDALLDAADMSNAALEDAELRGCKADGISLIYADLDRAKLDRGEIQQRTFTLVTMHDVESHADSIC